MFEGVLLTPGRNPEGLTFLADNTVIYQLGIRLLGTGLYLKLYLTTDYGVIFEARSLLQLWTECYCQFRIALTSVPFGSFGQRLAAIDSVLHLWEL